MAADQADDYYQSSSVRQSPTIISCFFDSWVTEPGTSLPFLRQSRICFAGWACQNGVELHSEPPSFGNVCLNAQSCLFWSCEMLLCLLLERPLRVASLHWPAKNPCGTFKTERMIHPSQSVYMFPRTVGRHLFKKLMRTSHIIPLQGYGLLRDGGKEAGPSRESAKKRKIAHDINRHAAVVLDGRPAGKVASLVPFAAIVQLDTSILITLSKERATTNFGKPLVLKSQACLRLDVYLSQRE